jgi:ATP-dependent exoDNAse (exonuclease V) alpha subunit
MDGTGRGRGCRSSACTGPCGARPPERWSAVQTVVADLTEPASPRHLTRDYAAVDERTFRAAVAEAAQGLVAGTDIDWLRRRVEMAPEMVRLPGGHWTTRSVIEAEKEVIATAERRAALPCDAPAEIIATAIQSARVPLSAEQHAAVQQLSASRLGLLSAPAGAGKGEVLRAVASARRASGKRVIAVAAAGETAQRFGKDISADLSMTVEGLARATTTGRIILSERDAVFVDEAGLLETSRWLTLSRLMDRVFSLTATGDAAQLAPIQAGGLWRELTARFGAATLSENFRARDPDLLHAWTDLREGRAADAFARLDRKHQIVLSPTRADSREVAVEQWDADRRAGAAQGRGPENYLLLATTSHVDVDILNGAAQRRRLEAGELGSGWIEVTAQSHAGRDRVERFHAGDRVAFSRQVRFGGWRPRVENGATGLSGDQLGALRLGYAQHVYSAQGRTVDRAYVVTGGWQAGRETTFVALSRAREATHVYSDYSSFNVDLNDRAAALGELASRARETQAKVSAVGRLEHEQTATREVPTGRRGAVAAPPVNALPEDRTPAEFAEEQIRRERRRVVYEEVERQREHHERDIGREF